jgi:hypothetical protein
VGFHEVESPTTLGDLDRPDESVRYLLLSSRSGMRDMLVRSRVFNYLAAAA